MITEQFDQLSLKLSKIITRDYSTSFSIGIYMLDKKFHPSIYAIYGFVRLADEIVDTFHTYDKAGLLEKFSLETFEAIEKKISTNPVLHSFQLVVNKYNIDRELIEAFLYSMKLDLSKQYYDENGYNEYIYGSAEVVGLMCLKVFCEGDEKKYASLVSPARKLGAAFQKVNFLRDMSSDFVERGRVYFPGVDFEHFTDADKLMIEKDINQDFEEAYQGILNLPEGGKLGVLTAYIYYKALFKKITLLPASKILSERIRVANSGKMVLLAKTWVRYHLKMI